MCNASCHADAACAGWNMIKNTPTSGQRGKPPLCMTITAAGLAASAPFYISDSNFACGSKKKLQPHYPPGVPGGGNNPVSTATIKIIFLNGSVTSFSNAASTYTSVTATSAAWSTALRSDAEGGAAAVTATLTGTVAVAASSSRGAANASELVWTLTSAEVNSPHGVVARAIDLGYGFAGLSGATATMMGTKQQKTWCPPGVGCEEWSGGGVQLYNADGSLKKGDASSTRSPNSNSRWEPPEIPWAFAALTVPGRSAFAAGFNPTVGYSTWSSQPALPYQAFASPPHAAGKGTAASTSGFSSGPSRINTNLRCGITLPFLFKVGFFADISGDGAVNENDPIIYTREQYPLADSIYRAGLVMKIDNDISSYTANEGMEKITWKETQELGTKLSHLADGTTVVLTMVGWQGSGHDTLYPTYNVPNPALGTSEELFQLAADLKKVNVLLSYHVNVDEAYKHLTYTQGTNYTVHPVPGTHDGQPNPDYVRANIASCPNGTEWVWSSNAATHSDPLQGDTFHLSKTKDAASGLRYQRLDSMLNAIPVDVTIHCDAYRDINDSWETDERGFIAEDEEAICGLQGDKRWLETHNLSLGVEGSNGMITALGPVPGGSGVYDYYWHSGRSPQLGLWNRIVGGSEQGLDKDITIGNSSFAMQYDWKVLGQTIYMTSLVYSLQMTDSLVGEGSDGLLFQNSGTSFTWPYGGDYIIYKQNGAVFLPAVLPPVPGAPKTAPTVLSQTRIRVYTTLGGTLVWRLPASWIGKDITSTALVEGGGSIPGPKVEVKARLLTLSNCEAFTPIILQV